MTFDISKLSASMKHVIDREQRFKIYILFCLGIPLSTGLLAALLFHIGYAPVYFLFGVYAGFCSTQYTLMRIGLRMRYQRVYFDHRDVVDISLHIPRQIQWGLLHNACTFLIALPIAGLAFILILDSGEASIDEARAMAGAVPLALLLFTHHQLQKGVSWLLSDKPLIHQVKQPGEWKGQLNALRLEQKRQAITAPSELQKEYRRRSTRQAAHQQEAIPNPTQQPDEESLLDWMNW